jgi:hypothetical protein
MRTTIAVVATTLFLGAMSAAGTLTHSPVTSIATANHARPAAISAPHALAFPDSESMTND